MGIKLEIGGKSYEVTDYGTSEDSTPLSVGDSSGGIGSIDFSIRNVRNPFLLQGKDFRLTDSRRGSTRGQINSVEPVRGTDLTRISCYSRLDKLNVYNVQAQPFRGTLEEAFLYYLKLANVTTDIWVDEEIRSKPVVFPGWFGELWFNFKNLAAAHNCEIALVGDVILMRKLRTRDAHRGRLIDSSVSFGGGSTALNVEVYRYDTRWTDNDLIYPPDRTGEGLSVISAGAGEETEYTLDLSETASIATLKPLEYQRNIGKTAFGSTSMYSVCTDDGTQLSEAAFLRNGGSIEAIINEDTTSVTIKFRAPTGLVNKDGEPVSTYTIGRGDGTTSNRYSTLRLWGSGAIYTKDLLRTPTGLTPAETSTEVGVTIDNPFLTDANDQFNAASRLAASFRGESFSLRGTTTRVNPRYDDESSKNYAKYSDVQAAYAGMTYSEVVTYITGSTPVNYAAGLVPIVPDAWKVYPAGGGELSVDRFQGTLGTKITPVTLADPGIWGDRTGVTTPGGVDVAVGDVLQMDFTYTVLDFGTNDSFARIRFGAEYYPDPTSEPAVNPVGYFVTSPEYRDAIGKFVTVTRTVASTTAGLFRPRINIFEGANILVSDISVRNTSAEARSATPLTYGDEFYKWDSKYRDEFALQVFGNANGARVWDEFSNRYYRIRSANVGTDTISYDADNDLMYSDFNDLRAGKTYGVVKSAIGVGSYRDVEREGLYLG